MKRLLTTIAVATVWGLFCTQGLAQPRDGGEGPRQPPRFNPIISTFDANGDGELGKAEIENAVAKLKALDANKDGKLTADEVRPPMGPGGPGGPDGRGPGGRAPGGAREPAAAIENPLLPKDDEEKKILAAMDEMRKGRRYANVPTADGRLLRQLTEAVNAKRVVEIGMSTGESAVWFSLALRKTGGKLITHEISPEMVKTAKENFKKAGIDDLITIVEGNAHETVKQLKDPIDVLFIDADKEGYIDYLEQLLPLVRDGGLIIAHNMRRPTPDPRYIKAITQNPKLETSFLFMDDAGVGVTLKKR